MRKILVTGLTGHLGQNLAKNLINIFIYILCKRKIFLNMKILKKSNVTWEMKQEKKL